MNFDDDYFGPAEGNLPFPPLSFVRQSTVRQGGDYAWSNPRIPQASILLKPMRSLSCDDLPAPTLNSFAAFSGANYRERDPFDAPFMSSFSGANYRAREGWGGAYGSFGVTEEEATAQQMSDMGGAGYTYTPNTVPTPQAAATKNNWLTDSVSGIVKAFTPVAQQYAGTQNTALMQQYLQGRLPGYTIGANGQLVKSTNWVPIAIGAAVVLGLVVFASKR